MDEGILQERVRYYRQRAAEYDVSILGDADAADPLVQEFRALLRIIARLTPCAQALDLACGTGLWTRSLLRVARNLLAMDAAPEMIALNQAKAADARVRYRVADLVAREPENPVDLTFSVFWLSHVPTERLILMLRMLRRAVRSGGQLCIIDEPGSSPIRPPAAYQGSREIRTLRDGHRFEIVKIYRSPEQFTALCAEAGFTQAACFSGTYFFGLIAH